MHFHYDNKSALSARTHGVIKTEEKEDHAGVFLGCESRGCLDCCNLGIRSMAYDQPQMLFAQL